MTARRSGMPDEGKDRGMQGSESGREPHKERLDRELSELLQELRVALPGVQFLFAFLLTVPFTQRWGDVDPVQRNAFLVAFVCATLATFCLLAPTIMHRIEFRMRDKEMILRLSNALSIWGLFFLGVAIVAVVFVVTDLVLGSPGSTALAVVMAILFAGLWFALPLVRRWIAPRDRRAE